MTKRSGIDSALIERIDVPRQRTERLHIVNRRTIVPRLYVTDLESEIPQKLGALLSSWNVTTVIRLFSLSPT